MTIKFFSILGERCSGTNFFKAALDMNFNIKYSTKFTHKHFFGFNDFEDSDDHLFIGIVRHPTDWLNSLWDQKHNLVEEMFENEDNFLNNEVKSYDYHFNYFNDKTKRFDLLEDYNLLTRDHKKQVRYRDLFELRKIKTEYLRDVMPNKVKNYIFINYETLRDNYEETLQMLMDKFKLSHTKSRFKKIKTYKGKYTRKYIKTKKRFLTTEKIIKKLNIESENKLGYTEFE